MLNMRAPRHRLLFCCYSYTASLFWEMIDIQTSISGAAFSPSRPVQNYIFSLISYIGHCRKHFGSINAKFYLILIYSDYCRAYYNIYIDINFLIHHYCFSCYRLLLFLICFICIY